MGELRRLFFAVPVEPEVASMLSQHLSRWEIPGKVVPPANWHLTVRFLGWTDPVKGEVVTALVDQAGRGGPFRLTLGALGAFPRATRAGVLWLGLDRGEEGLAALNRVVEEAAQTAGFQPEERPFAAHLTLSRLRPPADVSALIDDYEPREFRWQAQELILYDSRPGPVYVPVERFPLVPTRSEDDVGRLPRGGRHDRG
ncbi:MAG TPA: RNA 2',3'-cyclic phosphodiesterase [Acidimicrobiia bacterium]|nr:RNA 2',3'-cyclic phosphodiesterase [Acidimicrobiia bacterium]